MSNIDSLEPVSYDTVIMDSQRYKFPEPNDQSALQAPDLTIMRRILLFLVATLEAFGMIFIHNDGSLP